MNTCKGQNFGQLKFEAYTTEDGLLRNLAVKVLSDKRGYLWVHNVTGVSRFDGVKFSTYTGTGKNLNAMGGYLGFCTDSSGRLWMMGLDSLLSYDEIKDEFFSIPLDIVGKAGYVHELWHDQKHTLWISAERGLFKYNDTSGVLDSTSFKYPGATHFNKDKKGRIWICHVPNLLSRYDPTEDTSYTWKMPWGINATYITPEDDVWLLDKGMSLFDIQSGSRSLYRPEILPQFDPDRLGFIDALTCPEFTGDSLLWISSIAQGLYIFNLRSKKFEHTFVADPLNLSAIPSNSLWRMHWSPKGILWIASQKNGLVKLDLNAQAFLEFPINIPITEISYIIGKRNESENIYLASSSGYIYEYSMQKRQATLAASIASLNNNKEFSIACMYEDPKRTLWIGARNGLYSLKNGRLTKKDLPLDSKKESYVRKILPEKDGKSAWLLTGQGPCHYDFTSGETQLIPLDLPLKLSLAYPIRSMVLSTDGTIWVATLKGLYMLAPGSDQFKKIDIPPYQDYIVDYIRDISVDADGRILLCSEGLVYTYDPRTKKFEQIFFENEQITPVQFLPHPSGDLFVMSSFGLYKYHKTDNVFYPTSFDKGLDAWLEQGVFSAMHIVGDRFITSNEGRLIAFDPTKIDKNPNPALPVIENFRIRNRFFPFDKETVAKHPLRLYHNQNFVSFDFTGLNFTQSDRMQFQYILEGFEEDWVVANKGRSVSYTNLEPGNYTFKVLAANSAGNWDPQPAVFKFRIMPPFWETWWFRILAISMLIGTGYLIAQNQIRKIRLRAEIREREAGYKQREAELKQEVAEFSKQVAEVELAALRAQMNPHFVFNCLNSINTFILLNDPRNASLYLQKFSKLIRQVLDASRSEYISLNNELDTLRYYIELEQMRYGGKFAYIIEVSETIQQDLIDLPPMLVQPYVENAIWHGLMHKDGEDGLLRIDVNIELQNLQITIEDNGIGRKKAAEMKSKSAVMHKSHGMAVTDERIKIINDLYGTAATVKIDDLYNNLGEATGTRVTLILPLKRYADESYYA